MRWVLCRRCGRRLGAIDKGIWINKHGRQIIKAERALIVCPKCGEERVIDTGAMEVDKNG